MSDVGDRLSETLNPMVVFPPVRGLNGSGVSDTLLITGLDISSVMLSEYLRFFNWCTCRNYTGYNIISVGLRGTIEIFIKLPGKTGRQRGETKPVEQT